MDFLAHPFSEWPLIALCLLTAVIGVILYLLFKPAVQTAVFLDPDQYKEVPLVDKRVLSHNTQLFRYTQVFRFYSSNAFCVNPE